MNKKETQQLLETTFNHAFDETQFTAFIQEFLDGMEYRDNQLAGGRMYQAYADHISSYKRIGKYTDPDGNELDVLIVRVKRSEKLDRTRTALRNFVIRHLDEFGKDYALVAFYSTEDDGADWRFSFIKLEYESVLDEKGKVKVSRRETPAKRYSFLVGANEKGYTAKRQILEIMLKYYQPTVEQIEESFSIETVTDEFFEQYKELYISIQEYLEGKDSVKQALETVGIDTIRFTKKLLGQIVFLYFLQKKGWLGAPKGEPITNGERQFIQKLFNQSQVEGTNFYNGYLKYLFYEALAKERKDHYYNRLDCQIPFLNGGLFEAHHAWESDVIKIPDRFFRNQDKTKGGDLGTGVLDVFDRYNFTIKEDEPLEKEVAVDPEMLGKVFENMLEIKERKSKGAFYTPREIVHYMCQESLIHYLDNSLNDYNTTHNRLGDSQASLFNPNEGKKGQQTITVKNQRIRVPKNEIEDFIRKGHFALDNDNRVLETGKETKGYSFQTPESIRKNAKAIDTYLAEIKICDPAIGSGAFPIGLLHEVVQARRILQRFIGNEPNINPYRLKRHAIENSIYGVDIDVSAIDIARLRLWLSMIVEEEDYETIEALPNLDYKIVCGNSLIGLPENAMRDLKLEEELEKLKEEFFNETNEKEKKILRNKINTKIRQLLDSAETFSGYKMDFDFKLYFSEVWHQKNGFDVVIGNPPYVNIVNLPGDYRKLLKKLYSITKNKVDLYAYFVEQSYRLLGKNSVLAYIIPHTWKATSSFQLLREFILSNLKINKIVNLNMGIFNATVTPMILELTNKKSKDYDFYVFDKTFNMYSKINVREILSDQKKAIDTESPQVFRELYKKIESEKRRLGSILQFTRGIKTSNDKRFISTVKKDSDSFKVFRGKNIKRYYLKWGGEYIWYKPDKMREKVGCLPHTKELFQVKEKLITQRVNSSFKLIVAYDEDQNFFLDTTNVSKLETLDKSFKIKYLLCLLNSSVLNFWYCFKYRMPTIGLYELHSIPIIQAPIEVQETFETLANYLLVLQKLNASLLYSFFFELVDSLVFELYFKQKIVESGKQIHSHIGVLKPINEKLSEEEKLAIIQVEFDRLYDTYHPVRNNMNTIDSIEEIRIIKEAMQ